MARVDLSNPAKRDALKPRTSYYSHPLGSKRYVLMRVGKTGRTWGARVPGRPDKGLGPVDDMTFDQVADLVRKMEVEADDKPTALHTIGEALDSYVKRAGLTKNKRGVATIQSHINLMSDLRAKRIADVRLATLNKWRDDLITPDRGIATVNKAVGTLKAALNAHGVEGDWSKLKKLKEPKAAPAAILTRKDVDLVLAQLSNSDPDFHDLVKALWLTGARPGEIMNARKHDIRGNTLTLTGKTGTRHITLTPGVAAFLAARAAQARDNLLETDGRPFTPDMLKHRWDGLELDATPYALRHGFITSAIYAGVPIFPLAKHCGTSVEMIERTYGHILAEMQAEAFGALEQVLM
ncbi:tyrosine-type recombinase/integrase [Ruegeria sp. HKCCE4150]|uniref:tyrosine-type recombinase/integrase n=1 Tax=Ruegeria sp. HKCCE4150 TaxID=2794828 RepID=UPI001AE34106|nr:hypothetical protein [Ruegeria sp. HKCCE4150]